MSVEPSALGELLDRVYQQIQQGSDVDVERLAREHPLHGEKIAGMVRVLKELHAVDWSLSGDRSPAGAAGAGIFPTLGDFRLLEPIGRGGMGVVYEAAQLSIDRRVALKVLPLVSLIDGRALQRFRNEVQAAALIEHPNMVAVYSVGEDHGVHYYAMQLIRGPSLAGVIGLLRSQIHQTGTVDGSSISQAVSVHRWPGAQALGSTSTKGNDSTAPDGDTKPVQPDRFPGGHFDAGYFRNIATLGIQAARALDEAHQHGVIHRDVKPGNLLIDPQGTLFVTDFGLARIETAPGMTTTGDIMGTLRYMSPEQVAGDQGLIDSRTDQYSLGATLYELASLRPMFPETDRAGLINRILSADPDPLARVQPAIPADLATIIGKATRKSAGERYPRCRDLADELQRFLDNRPITARNPSWANRLGKWSRRNPLLVKAGLAGLVLATIGLVISNLLILEQKRIAEERTREAQRLQGKSDELAASETKARLQADELNTQTNEYNEILRGIFSGLDPREKKPDDPELAKLLADRLVQAGEQIGKNSFQRPHYQLELLFDLGGSLLNLGYADQALKLFQRADQIIEESAPADEPLWVALNSTNLGKAYLGCGKPDLATAAYQRGYDYYQLSEPEGTNTLACLHGLATCQYQTGNYTACIANLETLIPRRTRLLGETHQSTMTSMNVLAAAYDANGELDRALEWMNRVYQLRSAELGPNSVDTNTTRNNLANLLRSLGDDRRASELLEQASQVMLETVGEDHPDYNAVQINLATTWRDLGRGQEALAILEPAIERLSVRPGRDHPRTLSARFVHANLLASMNRMDEALPILRECLDAQVAREGESGPTALLVRVTLAEKLIAAGQNDDGRQLAVAALDLASEHLGPNHDTAHLARLALARGCLLAGDTDEAIAHLERAVGPADPKQAASGKNRLLIDCELAAAYQIAGQSERSRDLLRATLAAWQERLGPGHPVLVGILANLALVSVQLQDWEGVRQAVDKWEQNLTDKDHRWYHGQLQLQKSLVTIHTEPANIDFARIPAGCEDIAADLDRLNKLNQLPLRHLAMALQSALESQVPSPARDSAQQALSGLLTRLE